VDIALEYIHHQVRAILGGFTPMPYEKFFVLALNLHVDNCAFDTLGILEQDATQHA